MKNWSSEIKELKNYYQSLSGKIPDLEKELERLIKIEDEIGVLVSSRRCLEVMVTDICEKEAIKLGKTIPLKGIIDKLNKENKAPSHIITTMLNLNSSSTYGAHPKEFDQRQVRTVLINLTTIVEWYISYKGEEISSSKKKSVFDHPGEIMSPDTEQEYLREEDNEKPSKLKVWKIATYLSAIIIIVLGVLYIINKSERTKDIPELEKSIAVLPFENWSSDKEYAHIGDAMTDELILQLQYIEDFDRVLSRTSTFQYKDNKKPIPVIAKELGVNYIIEGSIQRKHENVSITVQVIRAINEDHIWAEEYTGKWKDIFTIQDKIAKQVAKELNTVLSPKEIEQIDKNPTENIEAYNLYLKGRFFWHRRTVKDLFKSIDYFNQALSLDTNFADAYVGLADTYFILPWYDDYPTNDAFARSEKYANKALLINKDLAKVHTILGELAIWHRRDWDLAEKELNMAIELNPNYYVTYQWYYELCEVLRRVEEAEEKINLAIQYNPNFFITLNQRASFYYDQKRYKEALEDYHKVLEIKYWVSSMSGILKCYLKMGKDKEAIVQVKNIVAKNDSNNYDKLFNEIYQKTGINGIIYWYIDWMILNKPKVLRRIASFYAILGDEQKAIEYLEKRMESDRPGKLFINSNSDFNFLRENPKFQAMLKKMKLIE